MFRDKWHEAPKQNYRGAIKDGPERCPAGIFFDNFGPEQVAAMKLRDNKPLTSHESTLLGYELKRKQLIKEMSNV